MKTKAAILVEVRSPLEIVELEVPALKSGQVLVRISYSGICRTQILEWQGMKGPDPFLPHCLGHEGSGTVVETGPNVDRVRSGDSVVLSWMKSSGADVPGTTYSWNGRTVNAGAVTTFQEMAVVSENRLTPIAPSHRLRDAAYLGCAIPTGFGAVFNVLKAAEGKHICVFGCGGIGLFAVSAAKLAGCGMIIAVDLDEKKLAAAKHMGATHTLLAGDHLSENLKSLTADRLDYAVEATGNTEIMKVALAAVRPRGGHCVIIGNAPAGSVLQLDPKELNQGKSLLGTWGGDNIPDRDFPRYAEFLAGGQINLDSFRHESYPLAKINEALTAFDKGEIIRPLIHMMTP